MRCKKASSAGGCERDGRERLGVALTMMAVFVMFAIAGGTARAQAHADPHWPQHAWITGDVGIATRTSLALSAAGVYSAGPLLVAGRKDAAGKWSGAHIEDQSILVGLRTTRRSALLTGALGFARARSYTTCADCGTVRSDPGTNALSFEARAYQGANPGRRLSVYGVVGKSQVSFLAPALSVQLGWLGN